MGNANVNVRSRAGLKTYSDKSGTVIQAQQINFKGAKENILSLYLKGQPFLAGGQTPCHLMINNSLLCFTVTFTCSDWCPDAIHA